MARKISVPCSASGINTLIQELQSAERRIDDASKRFIERLASEGMIVAHSRILNVSGYDKDKPPCNISTTYSRSGKLMFATIYLNGSEALFVEFGSGKRHNPYPNPKAGEFGYGVGTYSIMGHWDDPDGWWYRDANGNPHHSFGTGASMPMYYAKVEMTQKLGTIAKEVFENVI